MARSMPAAMILSQISRLACGGKESGTECARYSIVFEVHPGLDLHAALVQPPRGVAGVHAGPPCQRWQPALDFGMTETGTFADDADDDQPQQTPKARREYAGLCEYGLHHDPGSLALTSVLRLLVSLSHWGVWGIVGSLLPVDTKQRL